MKDQFEVWRFDFGKEKGGEHPAVLISHPDICARSKVVNVLYRTSQRQNRQPYPHEVALNGDDGMDWETFCDCSTLYAVQSALLFGRRGRVTLERRRAIRAKIRALFLLNATD
jgi:mRNA-degrading endonuclease toxin of MazEF toxin-antitoxin module